MKRLTRRMAALVGLVMILCVGSAHAAPITLNFTFSEAAVPNNRLGGDTFPNYHGFSATVVRGQAFATATGFITFERTLLANPGDNEFDLPNPAVLALTVTVQNAASGNGTFTLADFTHVSFDTNGGTLNLDAQLVGQPTQGDPWGTPSNGAGGDFNFFIPVATKQQGVAALPPNGVFFFTLGANGGLADSMQLTSLALAGAGATSVPVPTLSAWLMAVLAGLLCLGAALFVRGIRLR